MIIRVRPIHEDENITIFSETAITADSEIPGSFEPVVDNDKYYQLGVMRRGDPNF